MKLDEVRRALFTAHTGTSTEHAMFLAARLAADASNIRRNTHFGQRLSDREIEIYSYLNTPMTAEEIAAELFVSAATVRSHQASIYRKLQVTNRRDAVKKGIRT